MKKLNSLDLFDLRSELEEDEALVQDTVARFTDEQVLPIIADCFEAGRFPAELVPQAEFRVMEGMGHDLPPAYWGRAVDAIGANIARL